MHCAINTASTAFDDAETLSRVPHGPAVRRANLSLIGSTQPRFIPDSTQTDPECVLGDEGPVTTTNNDA